MYFKDWTKDLSLFMFQSHEQNITNHILYIFGPQIIQQAVLGEQIVII